MSLPAGGKAAARKLAGLREDWRLLHVLWGPQAWARWRAWKARIEAESAQMRAWHTMHAHQAAHGVAGAAARADFAGDYAAYLEGGPAQVVVPPEQPWQRFTWRDLVREATVFLHITWPAPSERGELADADAFARRLIGSGARQVEAIWQGPDGGRWSQSYKRAGWAP